MKRAIVYLAFFLANAVPADNESVLSGVGELTVSDLKQYEVFYCKADPFCVLVVAKDRAWGAAGRGTKPLALSNAMRACKLVSTMPHTCEVVDVNGDSGLLKKYLEKKGRSTIFASKKVWCANKKSVFLADQKYCNSRTDARGFSTKAQAQAVHQRLKRIATASTSGSKTVWCATKYEVWSTTRTNCGSLVRVFSNRAKAQAEHNRLKRQTTTASTSGSKIFWCADKEGIWSASKRSACGSAKVFTSMYTAQAEHKRLKAIATAPQTTPQPVQSTTVDNSALDLEFWQSIKDSNDPDMFQAYLLNYPTGAFVDLAKIKLKNLGGDAPVAPSIPNLDYGNYHALVIGNNRYPDFGDLKTPINDARTVARVLKSNYGFKVNVLENATESKIFKAIINLRGNVGRNDNVLIYYGGHGELDNVTDEGFWIPSDAKRDDPSTYLAVDRIRKQIKAMPAKHVMVVADSCFAGSLTRSTLTRALKVKPRSPEYHSELQRLINKKSRTALVSGGLEPVLDSGSGGHSVFAGAFISALENNDGVLDAHMLFIQVRENVRNNSPQNPEYSPIYETGHDHGDFLFVRQ
jgi:uncharacterized caspase-like protein